MHQGNQNPGPTLILKSCAMFVKNGHWEKRPYEVCMMVIELFSLDITLFSPLKVPLITQTPSRYPTDTFQTPYKHPKMWHISANLRQLVDDENKSSRVSFLSIACTLYPPDVSNVTQTTPDNSQTPSGHPSYTSRQLGLGGKKICLATYSLQTSNST